MKEEDLSRIKRYPIVEYLERKGFKPVRRTPSYALYRSPLREETHPSFKVDTEKNLWIDYGEGRGGSIIDLCMRMEGCTLSEAIRRLGQNTPVNDTYSFLNDFVPNNSQPVMAINGARRLIGISDTLPPYFQEYLMKERCIDLEKAMPFLKCISYEVRGRRYQAEPARNTESATVQRRISAKMRKKTLEAYKQAYLVPTKLNNRKAVYLSRETQERADFIVRRLGDRGSNLSSFVENIVRQHLEEYGEDIEKWRRL